MLDDTASVLAFTRLRKTTGTAHHSLLSAPLVLAARITRHTQLVILFVKAKVGPNGVVTDVDTREKLRRLATAFAKVMDGDRAELLPAPDVTSSCSSDEVRGGVTGS